VSDLEITALVLSEHEALRRDFAALADPERAQDLGAAWAALAARLEVHAVAEEELFYPLLASAAEHGAAEGQRAVKDHNEIRHAAAAVTGLDAGSEAWWTAVHGAQQVNADHMAEEERDFIPDFTAAVDDGERADLGMRWLQFHDAHESAQGLTGDDAVASDVTG